jgi:hypothetical protein
MTQENASETLVPDPFHSCIWAAAVRYLSKSVVNGTTGVGQARFVGRQRGAYRAAAIAPAKRCRPAELFLELIE